MSAMMYEDFKYRAENVVKLNKDKTAMRYLLENKKGDDNGADIISFSFGEIILSLNPFLYTSIFLKVLFL